MGAVAVTYKPFLAQPEKDDVNPEKYNSLSAHKTHVIISLPGEIRNLWFKNKKSWGWHCDVVRKAATYSTGIPLF